MLRRLAIAAAGILALTCMPSFATQVPSGSKNASPQATVPAGKAAKAKKAVRRNKPSPQKQTQQIPPPPPPPPPTLEDQPAVAPEVLYHGGQLTIIAKNATMSDVLSAVRRVTGANIDRPPSGGMERVVGQWGPGTPREVLASLLNGSRYDFIILGSMSRPGAIDRVLLTPRGAQSASTAVANNSPAQQQRPPIAQPAESDEPEAEPADTEDMTVPETTQPEAPQNQPEVTQPEPQTEQPQAQPPDQSQESPEQPKVKSPEELLRELQQMQQQQQQQQQPPPDQPR